MWVPNSMLLLQPFLLRNWGRRCLMLHFKWITSFVLRRRVSTAHTSSVAGWDSLGEMLLPSVTESSPPGRTAEIFQLYLTQNNKKIEWEGTSRGHVSRSHSRLNYFYAISGSYLPVLLPCCPLPLHGHKGKLRSSPIDLFQCCWSSNSRKAVVGFALIFSSCSSRPFFYFHHQWIWRTARRKAVSKIILCSLRLLYLLLVSGWNIPRSRLSL